MRIVAPLLFSLVVISLLSSCKKEYICQCSVLTTTSSGTTSDLYQNTFTESNKTDADFQCNSGDKTETGNGYTATTDCTLLGS